jgi:hypothetical protein
MPKMPNPPEVDFIKGTAFTTKTLIRLPRDHGNMVSNLE